MRCSILLAAVCGFLLALASVETARSSKDFTPGQWQTSPGGAKEFAPGQRQTYPARVKFAQEKKDDTKKESGKKKPKKPKTTKPK